MDRQQNLGRQNNNHQDSNDQFEEFRDIEVTPKANNSMKTTRKSNNNNKTERLKLKFLQQDNQNSLQNSFLNNNKRIRKAVSANSKVITIGGAIFRSNFESGNIQAVDKIAPNAYQIYLSKETNSERISAWFYFQCQGLKGQTKFIIKGFTKSSSLYNQGMRVCYREMGQNSIWRRGGSKICYTQSPTDNQQQKTTYQLRFTYFFKASTPNSVQFAYCFPYSYSQLIKFLSLSKSALSFESLTKSYQGRQIPLVTIGNKNSQHVVVISARAHPGETVGSWMMEGFLKQLISSSQYAKTLKQAFLFKIIPMINVDGVCQGNYRFSGAGYDLNRKWKRCKEKIHPQIYYLKQYLKDLNKKKDVIMYIDLHGHSRQKNVFFYGCCPKGAVDSDGNPNNKPKQFPFLMSKLHSSFRYDFCSYAMQKDKQGTARITMWNQLKIDYVYTCQASFCGNQGGQNYLIADYQKIGSKLCQGICLYFSPLISKNLSKYALSDKKPIELPNKIAEQLKKNMNQFYDNPELAQIQFEGNSSDSQPEAGEIPEEKRKNGSSIISLPKNHKASKMLKYTQKSKTYDERSLKQKLKQKQRQMIKKEAKKNNNSVNLVKDQQNKKIQKPESQQKSRQIKTSTSKSHNSYSIRADILNKTINEKLYQLQKNKNRTQENHTSFLGKKQHGDKFQSEELFATQKPQIVNNKKKAISFQGAQYRRVRKLAQQHNRKHFSVQHNAIHDQDELIKGLSGMNQLLKIDQVKASSRPPSFFPNTISNHKHRKQSVQMHFRKQIKAQDYHTRRIQINGLQQDVKCFGKHIG